MKIFKSISAGILISLTAIMSRGAPLFSEQDQQVNALLAQMTLDEKIGQMVQVDSSALKDKADVQKYFLGSVLSGGDSDPADWQYRAGLAELRHGISKPGAANAAENPADFTASTPFTATTTWMAR